MSNKRMMTVSMTNLKKGRAVSNSVTKLSCAVNTQAGVAAVMMMVVLLMAVVVVVVMVLLLLMV